MKVATIDFETRPFNRRPDYPPPPVGVSIKMPDKPTRYYAFGHCSGNNCTFADAERALQAAWKYPILGHNMKFDYDVALNYFDVAPKPWSQIHDSQYLVFLYDPNAHTFGLKESAQRILDIAPDERDELQDWILARKREFGLKGKSDWAAGIWRAPGDLAAPYANGDVDRTWALFKHCHPIIALDERAEAYDRERKLMPFLLEQEARGIRVDRANLVRARDDYGFCMEHVEAWMRKRLKTKDLNFDADADVASVLDEQGVVTDWELTATGKKSTAKGSMTLDKFHDHELGLALAYRNRLATCLSTFMDPWLDMSAASGRIYTNWNQTKNDAGAGARTGRLSSNPNFQNIPSEWEGKGGYTHPKFIRRLTELPMLRRFILPDEGGVILKRDYSQQEYRILAHFEDGDLLRRYNQDPWLDMHDFVKEKIRELIGQDLDRKVVKTLNFGILYGMGKGKLAHSLGVTMEEADRFKRLHKQALPDVQELDKGLKAMGRNGEPMYTWGGRQYYCEPPQIGLGVHRTFEYRMLNTLIQGSAADCTKEAMNRYADRAEHGTFMLTIHDELEVSAPIKHAKNEMRILRECMESVEFDVPMLSDGAVGPNWYELTPEEKYTWPT